MKKINFIMKSKYWKKTKITTSIFVGVITFILYLHSAIKGTPLFEFNEMIEFSNGMTLPYGICYIILPAFCGFLVYGIFDNIEDRCLMN